MREIKFRAWNKEHKEIEYSFAVGANGKVFGVLLNMGELRIQNIELTDTLELMQFTGLKDKNGVEIYEGDIVSIENWSNSSKKWIAYAHEVVFRNGAFLAKRYGYYTSLTFLPNRIEVIGNIYENKELLKEENNAVKKI